MIQSFKLSTLKSLTTVPMKFNLKITINSHEIIAINKILLPQKKFDNIFLFLFREHHQRNNRYFHNNFPGDYSANFKDQNVAEEIWRK